MRIRVFARGTKRNLIGKHFKIRQRLACLLRLFRCFRLVNVFEMFDEVLRLLRRIKSDGGRIQIFERVRHQPAIGFLCKHSCEAVHGREFTGGERILFR